MLKMIQMLSFEAHDSDSFFFCDMEPVSESHN